MGLMVFTLCHSQVCVCVCEREREHSELGNAGNPRTQRGGGRGWRVIRKKGSVKRTEGGS